MTDNEPLTYLLRQSNPTGRNARWIAILSEYRITNIRHLKGISNIVPDMLSRLQDDNIETAITDSLPWQVNANTKWRPPADPCQQQQTKLSPETKTKDSAEALINAQRKYKPFSDIISYLNGKA